MIATWMLYCLLCAVALSAAALLAERVLLAGRAPVRFVWVGAVGFSLLVPAAAYRFAPRHDVTSEAGITQDVSVHLGRDSTVAPLPLAKAASAEPSTMNWRDSLSRLDAPLALAWIISSLLVAFNFLGGIIALSWMRRRWQRDTILGVPVFVSDRTGPAVVGAVSPAIVVPQWALSLEPTQLALMLRHEQEHHGAGDGRLLTASQLALVLMPWNVALWWQILRLRVAVELDCDARVLQSADPRSYGNLLLEVARPRRGPRLTGATAFAERATQLERRIRVLPRHRWRTSRAACGVAGFAGLVAVTGAWVMPHPPVPARTTATPAIPSLATAIVETARVKPLSAPEWVPRSNDRLIPRESTLGRRSTARTSVLPARDTTTSSEFRAIQDAQGRPALVDSAFNRLFEGITLTPDQQSKVRDLLVRLQQDQLAADRASLTLMLDPARTTALRVQRDSTLRALLTNDADRAAFNEHVKLAPGGRGRSAGPAPGSPRGAQLRVSSDLDSLFSRLGTRVGGGGRRGRSGGAGVPGADARSQWRDPTQFLADANFRRLFAGISLTTDQETKAREIIARTQPELTPQRRIPEIRLRLSPNGVVAMKAPSDSALAAILSSEADRAKLRTRIAVIPR